MLEARGSEHDRSVAVHNTILAKAQLELANLITKHTTQRKDLDVIRHSESQYKTELEAARKHLEERNDGLAQCAASPKDVIAEQPEAAKSESDHHHTGNPLEPNTVEKELRQELDTVRSQLGGATDLTQH